VEVGVKFEPAIVRFVSHDSGPHLGKGYLYINGQKVGGVLDIKPDLFPVNDVATVTLTLAVRSFEYVPSE
jgi:hypothetical protein